MSNFITNIAYDSVVLLLGSTLAAVTSIAVVDLYEYCLREKIADQNLIAKWKKQGYENLCCLRCIQVRDTNFGANCICRVPKAKLEEVRFACLREVRFMQF